MKKALFALSLLLVSPIIAHHGNHDEHHHDYIEIQTEELKDWYDNKKDMIVLDARSEQYFDGNLLPRALWVPHNSTDEEIESHIPSKTSVIVVYCSNKRCPAGEMLAEKLTSKGYKNVYKYPDGIKGWMQKGYPTEKHKKA